MRVFSGHTGKMVRWVGVLGLVAAPTLIGCGQKDEEGWNEDEQAQPTPQGEEGQSATGDEQGQNIRTPSGKPGEIEQGQQASADRQGRQASAGQRGMSEQQHNEAMPQGESNQGMGGQQQAGAGRQQAGAGRQPASGQYGTQQQGQQNRDLATGQQQ